MIDDAFDTLLVILERAQARDAEYVLFGSAVLYLHGLRAPETVGDIDVFVSRRVWGAIFGQQLSFVRTPQAGDPPFIERVTDPPLHIFYDWTVRDSAWITMGECFLTAENVRGWQCASLATIRGHKSGAAKANPGSERHAKHLHDIERIDAHLDAEGITPIPVERGRWGW